MGPSLRSKKNLEFPHTQGITVPLIGKKDNHLCQLMIFWLSSSARGITGGLSLHLHVHPLFLYASLNICKCSHEPCGEIRMCCIVCFVFMPYDSSTNPPDKNAQYIGNNGEILPGKALRTLVDIARLAERFSMHSQSRAW